MACWLGFLDSSERESLVSFWIQNNINKDFHKISNNRLQLNADLGRYVYPFFPDDNLVSSNFLLNLSRTGRLPNGLSLRFYHSYNTPSSRIDQDSIITGSFTVLVYSDGRPEIQIDNLCCIKRQHDDNQLIVDELPITNTLKKALGQYLIPSNKLTFKGSVQPADHITTFVCSLPDFFSLHNNQKQIPRQYYGYSRFSYSRRKDSRMIRMSVSPTSYSITDSDREDNFKIDGSLANHPYMPHIAKKKDDILSDMAANAQKWIKNFQLPTPFINPTNYFIPSKHEIQQLSETSSKTEQWVELETIHANSHTKEDTLSDSLETPCHS
jgi:hypothetical protein